MGGDEEELRRQERFAALGAFVQRFEAMVEALRAYVVMTLAAGRFQRSLRILLHHRAMTAAPLNDIFLHLSGEYCGQYSEVLLRDEVKANLVDIAAAVHAEVQKLIEARNRLLHGTWYIGGGEPDEDGNEYLGHRLKGTKEGLSGNEMPKNLAEIEALTARCRRQQSNISALHSYIWHPGFRLELNFRKVGKKWDVTFEPYEGQIQP